MSKFEEYIKAHEETVKKLDGYFNGKEHVVLCNLYHYNQKYYPYSKTTDTKKEVDAKYAENCLLYNYVLGYLGYTFESEGKTMPMEAMLKYAKSAEYLKENAELIAQIENDKHAEGVEIYNAIEYILSVYPGLREQMTSVFGSQLINEQRFPIKDKVKSELAAVKTVGEEILARRKIELLTDEEVRETYLGKATLVIDNRIESYERQLAENLVFVEGFTKDNPRYKQLQDQIEQLKREKETKEAELADKKTSEMREELLAAYRDYQKEYDAYKKAQKIKGSLPEGATISSELAAAEENVSNRLAASADALRMEIENATKEGTLAALDELMTSDEWKNYFADSKDVGIKWSNVLESRDKCQEVDAKLNDMSGAEERYEKLGFFAKRGEEGKELKEKFSPERKESLTKEKDTEIETLHHRQEEHSKSKEKLTESVAELKAKVKSLNLPGVGYFEGVAFIAPDKLAAYYQELKEQCKAAIFSNNMSMNALNDHEESASYPEAISEKLERERGRVDDLKEVLEVDSSIEKNGQEYYDAIETAVDLLKDAESYGTEAAESTTKKAK